MIKGLQKRKTPLAQMYLKTKFKIVLFGTVYRIFQSPHLLYLYSLNSSDISCI